MQAKIIKEKIVKSKLCASFTTQSLLLIRIVLFDKLLTYSVTNNTTYF